MLITNDLTNDNKLDVIVIDSNNDQVLVLQGLGNGSFSLITKHSTGYKSDPSFVAIGDFNEDGQPDIVISNNNTNTIVILSSFATYPNGDETTYFTGDGSYPVRAALADINDDGHLDVLIGTSLYPTMGILFGIGDGTFRHVETFFVNTTSEISFDVADMNNDGYLDIVIDQYDVDLILIYFGLGNGSFVYGETIYFGNNLDATKIALGDFNNDQIMDIVFTTFSTNSVTLILRFDHATTPQIITYNTGNRSRPIFVVTSDINNDQSMDFLVAMYANSSISIYVNDGNGSFHDPIRIELNNQNPIFIALGDLNGDDRLDIVFVSSFSSTVGIVLANTDGSFTDVILYSTGRQAFPVAVTLGHFNNDALLDIAIVNEREGTIYILIGYGNGTFGESRTFLVGYTSSPIWITLTDLNHDKQDDILICNSNENFISVFLIHPEADFTKETTYRSAAGPHPSSIVMADFNDDNRLDVAVANSGNENFQILLDYDDSTFSNKIIYSSNVGSHPQYVIVADFNNDNHSDIAIANTWADNIHILQGHGDGTFDDPLIYSTGSGSAPHGISVGNFNDDAWIDMAVANKNTDTVHVFLAFDYPTFSKRTINVTDIDSSIRTLVVGDFNHDERCDIAVTDDETHTILIFLGHGDGTFKDQMSYFTGTRSAVASLKAVHVNHDDHLDLVFYDTMQDTIGVFIGDGNGSFSELRSFAIATNISGLIFVLGDFNNDGYLDAAITTIVISSVVIFLGDGNGSFGPEIVHVLPYDVFIAAIGVADFNNDAKLDVVIGNSNGNTFGILLGKGNGSLETPIVYSTGDNYGLDTLAVGDLNGDDKGAFKYYVINFRGGGGCPKITPMVS